MACRGVGRARQLCQFASTRRRRQPLTCLPKPWNCPKVTDVQFEAADWPNAPRSRHRSRRTCPVTNAQAAAADVAGTGWKDEAAIWTLYVTTFIYISGLAMLAPVFPSILHKLNAGGSLEPAKAMGLLVSTYAACMCALTIVNLIYIRPGVCCHNSFRCYGPSHVPAESCLAFVTSSAAIRPHSTYCSTPGDVCVLLQVCGQSDSW